MEAKNNVLNIGVNYNSYDSVIKYINSIKNAITNSNNLLNVRLVITDNSSKQEQIDLENTPKELIIEHLFTNSNLGYIGAIEFAINELNIVPESFDYIVFSNVDVWLEDHFFDKLSKIDKASVGIIAPSIYSFFEKKDRNPKLLSRYSKRKLIFLKYLYRFPNLFYLYSILARKKPHSETSNVYQKEIYAPHGSFMIFTSEYFEKGGSYHYPCFLFGEEIFFAEEAIRLGLKVNYINAIKVNDSDHVSTKKLSKKKLANLNYKAIKYILNNYY